MPTRYVRPTAVTFAFSGKPGREFMTTAQDRVRVDSGQAEGFFRFRPTLPTGETLVEAYFEVTAEQAVTPTLTARRMVDDGRALRGVNWTNRPTTAAPGSVDVVGVRAGRLWRFAVPADVAAGGAVLLRLTSNDTTSRWFKGPRAAVGYPRLVLVTVAGAVTPTGLRPAGVIGVAAPVVQWVAQAGVIGVQAQADEVGGDFSAPDWTSGEIATSDGVVDTASAGWGGVGVDGSADLRVRQRVASGWSAWSAPVTVTRVAKPVVAVSNPGPETGDATPPVQWSVSGGVQAAWQMFVIRDGAIVADSGKRPGGDTLWTPPAGASRVGDAVTYRLRVWDGVARAESPGDPAYVEVEVTSVYQRSGTVAPYSTLNITRDPYGPPFPVLTVTRGELPDFGDVERDGVIVARLDPDEYEWVDVTAPPNQDLTYRVLAVADNATAEAGPAATVNLTVTGLWIVDPASGRGFVLAGTDLQAAYGDVTGVYTAVTANELVTRVSALRGVEGSMTGRLDEWPGRSKAEQLADVWWLRANAREVRLIAGDLNVPVNVRGLQALFDPETSVVDNIDHNVRFEFSQAGRGLPWSA